MLELGSQPSSQPSSQPGSQLDSQLGPSPNPSPNPSSPPSSGRLQPLPFLIPTVQDATSLPRRVAYLLSDCHDRLPQAAPVLADLHRHLPATLAAFAAHDPAALLEVHETLYQIYEASLGHPLSPICQHEQAPWLLQLRSRLETAWLQAELPRIQSHLPDAALAQDATALCRWFADQAQQQSELDRRLLEFLAVEATAEQFKLFILSDAPLDGRFCDALALAQIQFSDVARAEIVHNMADECRPSQPELPHAQQFARMLHALGLQPPIQPIWNDWRPYAGYNLHFCFGLNRRHFFKALGSLAMPELFDPQRNRAVVAGLERLYSDAPSRCQYFYNHIEIDTDHGQRWLKNVIGATVAAQPEAGLDLAIGGALRMQAMHQYNEYLALRFGLVGEQPNIPD